MEAPKPQGLREFALHDLRKIRPCDSLNEFADNPAIGQPMVAMRLPGSMHRTSALDSSHHSLPIEHLPGIADQIANAVEARFMA